MNDIFPASVEQVWQWNPAASTSTFTSSPSVPAQPDVLWHVWFRGSSTGTLSQLTGNAAYLVKVADGTASFNLSMVGKPLPPVLPWKSSGVNLVGFPTAPTGAPNFFNFFKYSVALKNGPTIFQYVGGALSDVAPKNPAMVTQPAATTVNRNQAYWIQSTAYTDFYGPLSITLAGPQGVDFGDKLVAMSIRLKNVTDPAQSRSLTATLTPRPSVTPPTGQPANAGAVPLLIRGAFNPVTGQFSYTPLSAPLTLASLAPGESMDVVLAVDRSALGNNAGDVFQSLLRITDSLGYTQVDLPVRAVSTSLAGLWVGVAVVNNVNQILGQTTTPAAAPSNFPIRIILHRNAAGVTTLLQEVYLGDVAGTPTALSKLALDHNSTVTPSVRLSSASFRRDLVVSGAGQLAISGTVNFSDTIGATDPTNPFYHKYHPDHDNLDAKFQPITAGAPESYAVTRAVKLTFAPPAPGDFDPTWGSTTLGGTYSETLTGLRSQPIAVSGVFLLHLVANPSTLLTQ